MPGVSIKIFNTYRCYTFDDGSSVMIKDASISCLSTRYHRAVAFASTMIFFYPLGEPGAFSSYL